MSASSLVTPNRSSENASSSFLAVAVCLRAAVMALRSFSSCDCRSDVLRIFSCSSRTSS